ncbi:sporulation protein [Rubripirellula reticaptiva]|uniref:Arrestin-like N-terminal domain-containing protein n=1 Tax=Rubripirellula reticaptiva TaxID=2528013 RepID=A0A5C6F9S6_9BACT|nr:sporulation protein [Rubripirellula reticaptiva]TWU57207.1 hypothetical protein Poly59_01130 [Rubripirellula reticaptiva]
MSKCDLSIELDHPNAIIDGGSKITGVVRARTNADVNCKSLEVKSVWKTHGRGNVATGQAGSITLFEGQWQAGENNEYRFELPVANWPPTYHGFHLNIDHSVEARVKVPWAFDPKASASFVMRPTNDLGATAAKKTLVVNGKLMQIIGLFIGVIFVVIGSAVARNFGVFGLIFLLVPIGLLVLWIVKHVMPKWVLGEVECELASSTCRPGETVTGEIVVRPRKNVSINGITAELRGREQCISGSGSNQKTHVHVFYEDPKTLTETTTLTGGQANRFPIEITLPADAAVTVSLNHNELIWSTNLRIDIPRWPDWTKELPITVMPSEKRNRDSVTSPSTVKTETPGPTQTAATASAANEGEITFAETARHLMAVRDDRQQVEMLAEAVTGMSFDIEAEVERRLLYAGDDDPHVYKDGFAVWARYSEPSLPLVLYVPHHLGDEFEQSGRGLWRGRGTIVGWDGLHGRLQIKL